MIPKYLYLYVSSSSTITIHYQNPNPTVINYSMHAHVFFSLPDVAFLVHALFLKIVFLSTLVYFQQLPNNNMWLFLSHLIFLCLFDLLGDCLELFLEICCLCLRLCSLLLECVYHLDYNFIVD
jgi:hypothetical protein